MTCHVPKPSNLNECKHYMLQTCNKNINEANNTNKSENGEMGIAGGTQERAGKEKGI